MASRAYLTPEQIDRIVVLRERGLGYRVIAAEVGCKEATVYWHCVRLGVEAPKPSRLRPDYHRQCPVLYRAGRPVRAFTPDEDARIVELALGGNSPFAIKDAVGRPYSSVRNRLLALARREARQEAAHA